MSRTNQPVFNHRIPANLPADLPPQLIVVIDTEEEFDWQAEPDAEATQVSSMEHIDRVQDIFNEYGVRPCYVVDYPVCSQETGFRLLKSYAEKQQCEIGAHLHPWVNPPKKEVVSRYNSYPGNLTADLEEQKLTALRDKIAETFGAQPVSYKAGRYGFGPNTSRILKELGFQIDLSVCPPLDSRADGGPDYRRYTASPFWFGDNEPDLLELPCTGAFVGWAGRWSLPLYELGQRMKKLRAPGILAKSGAVDRLMLSPEGFHWAEHQKLVKFLLGQGMKFFTWSFHSPSVVPGHTTYVQNKRELQIFLDSFRRFFDFFFETIGGQATTPSELKMLMERNTCEF